MRTINFLRWAMLLYASPNLTSAQQTPNDILQSGPYVIQLCGANAQYVKQDLDLIWNALQGVIADAHYGTSSPAYRAFFKDSIYDAFVDEMFTNITTGASIQKLNANTPASPAITCITGPDIVVEHTASGKSDLWSVCADNPNFAAFYRSGTNWIFLCPFFFQLVQRPVIAPGRTSVCPIVSGNQFRGKWGLLVQNQMYILMHEILHFYLGNSPPPATNSATEVNDINAAFELSSVDTISNAQSYVFYAAMVANSCKKFPTATADDPKHCRGRCLKQLGGPAYDIVDVQGTLEFNGVTVDQNAVP